MPLPDDGSTGWPLSTPKANTASSINTAPPAGAGTSTGIQELYAKLYREEKIRDGAENLLHELEADMQHHNKLITRPSGNRKQVLAQLKTAKQNIEKLQKQIASIDGQSVGAISGNTGNSSSGASGKPRASSVSNSIITGDSSLGTIYPRANKSSSQLTVVSAGASNTSSNTGTTSSISGGQFTLPTTGPGTTELDSATSNLLLNSKNGKSDTASIVARQASAVTLGSNTNMARQKKAPLRIRANFELLDILPGQFSGDLASPRPLTGRNSAGHSDIGSPDAGGDDTIPFSSPQRAVSHASFAKSGSWDMTSTESPPKFDPKGADFLPGNLAQHSQSQSQIQSQSQPASGSISSTFGAPGSSGSGETQATESDAARWFSNLMDSLSVADDANLTISRIYVLAQLLSMYPVLRTDFVLPQICEKVRPFVLSKEPALVAVGYRLVRLVSSPTCAATLAHLLCLDYLVERSLAREGGTAVDAERNQALLLVRALLADTNGADNSSLGLIRSLVAVAEHQNDRLQQAAIETLAEITVMAPEKAYLGGAVPLLLKVLVDGSRALAMPIAMVMANLLDRPDARQYLRNGADLACVASIFTEQLGSTPPRNSPSIERINTTVAVIVTLLRSWAGCEAINTAVLIQCLLIPRKNLQEALLELFLAVFGRKNGRDLNVSQFTKHFTARLLQRLLNEELIETLLKLESSGPPKSVQRLTQDLLGLIFSNATLYIPPEMLQRVIDIPTKHFWEEDQESLASLTLPIAQVYSAMRGPPVERIRPVEYYNQLIVPWTNDQNGDTTTNGGGGNASSSSGPDLGNSSKPTASNPSSVWAKVGSQMDDAAFKALVNSTHVLTTKVYSRWNWDSLLELIEGPLFNPKRLEELSRTSKFMKRLMSFYRPFKFLFSNARKTKQGYLTYVHVGKVLLTTLLSTTEGRRYLGDNKLLRQIAECLAQLDPTSGIVSTEPLLSPQRLKTTLSSGYFELLGAMSGSEHGLVLLGQLRIWNMLYSIFDTDREDVIKLILASFDYTQTGHSRLLLRKALQCGSLSLRVFATELLPILALKAQNKNQRSSSGSYWIIKALVDQLYDLDRAVCAVAVKGLLVTCRIDENVDHFITLNPSIAHLGTIGDPLYMLFLSRKAGFESLSRLDFINQKMDHWVHGSNEAHVELIEDYLQTENLLFVEEDQTHLATLFSPDLLSGDSMNFRASCPTHFFGDIVLTEEGANLLMKRGYIATFAAFVEDNVDATDEEIIVKLKGCLWTLGHAGSHSLGAELISLETVEAMCLVYSKSLVRSLQATAFFAIGLLSTSFEGAEMLRHCGWGSTTDSFGNGTGIALVVNKSALGAAIARSEARITANKTLRDKSLERELSPGTVVANDDLNTGTGSGAITSLTCDQSFASLTESVAAPLGLDSDLNSGNDARLRLRSQSLQSNINTWKTSLGQITETESELPPSFEPRFAGPEETKKDTPAQAVLRAISDLSNHILAHEASKRLVTLRAQRPQLFQNSELFRQSLGLIAQYRYKQLVRRFLFELFDTSLIVEKQMRRRALRAK